LGNCYILASLGAAAEFPELVYDMFDERTREYNDAGVYGLRFYLRGKPWVLDIDDLFLYMYQGNPSSPLHFATPVEGGGTWNMFVEKGWAKLKGSYESTDQGFYVTGLRALTGAPAFTFLDVEDYDSVFETLVAADEAGYLMGVSSVGSSDQ